MRKSVGAGAIIERTEIGSRRWLARWNAKWGAFHLVGGHCRPDESFRDCLAREVTEELGLAEGRDFRIAAPACPALEYTAFSGSAGVETRYTIELFRVQLLGDAEQRASQDPENCWLTEDEIRAGRTAAGRPVSATMGAQFLQAGLLAATA
jgi:8-oxo-dGTP pyrophosphatase MutT (NUDIX family)